MPYDPALIPWTNWLDPHYNVGFDDARRGRPQSRTFAGPAATSYAEGYRLGEVARREGWDRPRY